MEARYCQYCGSSLDPGVSFCSNCGARIRQGVESTQYPQYRHLTSPRKDPMIALILALVLGLFGIWGIGHIYLGRIVRGVGFLLLGLLAPSIILILTLGALVGAGSFPIVVLGLLILLLIVLFILFVLHVYDAYALANRYNEILERTGMAPW